MYVCMLVEFIREMQTKRANKYFLYARYLITKLQTLEESTIVGLEFIDACAKFKCLFVNVFNTNSFTHLRNY